MELRPRFNMLWRSHPDDAERFLAESQEEVVAFTPLAQAPWGVVVRLKASELMAELHDTVAVSAGAACHADSVTISHVLQAMQLPPEWAMGTIRFSVGIPTTEEEIDTAAALIADAVARLRAQD